jgi:hypothetical protein
MAVLCLPLRPFRLKLRNESMMMKSESPSPISSRASYFADSQSDADNEEGGVLEDKNTTSEANSPDSVRDDIALQLATQLYAFQGCTKEQHEQQDHQHRLHHQRADVDPRCVFSPSSKAGV